MCGPSKTIDISNGQQYADFLLGEYVLRTEGEQDGDDRVIDNASLSISAQELEALITKAGTQVSKQAAECNNEADSLKGTKWCEANRQNFSDTIGKRAVILKKAMILDGDPNNLSLKEMRYVQMLVNESDAKNVAYNNFKLYVTKMDFGYEGTLTAEKDQSTFDIGYVANNFDSIAKAGVKVLFDENGPKKGGKQGTFKVETFDKFDPNKVKIENVPSGLRGSSCGTDLRDALPKVDEK